MGDCQSIKEKENYEKFIVIWIDPQIDNEENTEYASKFKSMNFLSIKLYKNVNDAIIFMKTIHFEETKIIVSGKLFPELIRSFKENILDMNFAPIILIFTNNINGSMNNEIYKDDNNIFYKSGGITTIFDEVEVFLKKEKDKKSEKNKKNNDKLEKTDEIRFTFEYIDKKEKLMWPMFFKVLIEKTSHETINNYNKLLYERYSEENKDLKSLLGSIKSLPKIPIEILSKYYARLYTAESSFYGNLNRDLGLNKIGEYLSFIQVLYEGVKFKSLPLANDKILYRGAKISKDEIEKIKSYLEEKKKDLLCAIVFSKSFLSFSKEKNRAEVFLSKQNYDTELSKVLFILEKDSNIGYNLTTHADIEKISFIPEEREVLFFPFSSFEIKEIREVIIYGEKIYEIKLLYLGKYLKEIEGDKSLTINGVNIPDDSEFKKQLCEFGLIPKETIENSNTKVLFNKFKQYVSDINKGNIITGEINIELKDMKEKENKENNKNKENIQIINSFENLKRKNIITEGKEEFNNEKNIKENIEIKIDGKIIGFNYCHKFEKKGKHKIEYLFKKKFRNINHMFYQCSNFTKLDFSNFDSNNITNMSNLFCGCNSLVNINLSNIKTQNVKDMSHLFSYCNSLSNLDLSNFDTQNVTDMSYMFYKCDALRDLNLSKFNTINVNNFSNMFSCCENLSSIDLSNFNTQNVVNMSEMFNGCKALRDLNLSNFNTQNVNNMSYIFSGCDSLEKLNLFNFNVRFDININNIFSGCKCLQKDKIITKDSKILKAFGS